jgi:hypothetical protein
VRDVPYLLVVSEKVLFRPRDFVRVEYKAGYRLWEVPLDLKCACIELAAWNFQRFKNNKIGVNSEFEGKMPEAVREAVEGFRRRVI